MIRYIPFIAAAGGGGEPHGLLFFFGVEDVPSETVFGDPVTKREEFLTYLSGVANEPFDSFSVGTSASLSVVRNGTTCTIEQYSAQLNDDFTDVIDVATDVTIGNVAANGRFNTSTTSDRWIEGTVQTGSDVGAPSGIWFQRQRVQFTFSVEVAAFGFYGTDFGDFAAGQQILALITDQDDVETSHIVTDNTVLPDGSLIFWGFVDDTKTYKKVVILVNQAEGVSGVEGLGIDDLVVATPAYLA